MQMTKAFSLVELLFVLLLVSIALVFLYPSEKETSQNLQVKVIQKEIIAIIQYARTQALQTGTNLALTPLSDDWSKGMLLFVDNPTHRYSQEDTLIHQWQWKKTLLKIQWQGFRSKDFLIFSSDILQSAVNGHFSIVSQDKEVGKIVVNRLGRAVES